MSFGLNLMEAGTLETDDYSLEASIDWSDYMSLSAHATWTHLSVALLRPLENLSFLR